MAAKDWRVRQVGNALQKAQWRLTVQLVNRLGAVNAHSGQLMKAGLLPTNLHNVEPGGFETSKVLKVPS